MVLVKLISYKNQIDSENPDKNALQIILNYTDICVKCFEVWMGLSNSVFSLGL